MSSVTDHPAGQRRIVIWTGAALLVLAAVLYLLTLDNGFAPGELVGGDLITHQYAQVEARPSNAPGYPLYTMGGWAWFHTLRGLSAALGSPLPNPIPILSSYSTAWALLALGLGRSVRAGWVGRIAAALLVLAGLAMVGLASPTDPTPTTRVATLAGRIHDLSYVALGLTLFLIGLRPYMDDSWLPVPRTR